eukprot:6042973-Prymnesium_polylepis.2
MSAHDLNVMYNAGIEGPDNSGGWPDAPPCDSWGASCGGLGIHGIDIDLARAQRALETSAPPVPSRNQEIPTNRPDAVLFMGGSNASGHRFVSSEPHDCDTHCHVTCDPRPSFCPSTANPISFSYIRKDLMFTNITSGEPRTKYRAEAVYSDYNPGDAGPLGIISRPEQLTPLCIFPLDGNTDARGNCGCAGNSDKWSHSSFCPDWELTRQQVNWCDSMTAREYWLANTLYGGQMDFTPRSKYLNGTEAPTINFWQTYA